MNDGWMNDCGTGVRRRRHSTTDDGDGDGDGFTARRDRRWRAKRGVVGDATVDANLVDEKDEDDDDDDDDDDD